MHDLDSTLQDLQDALKDALGMFLFLCILLLAFPMASHCCPLCNG